MINISESDLIIVGVDILPHTSPSRVAHYAVCVFDANKEEIIKKYEKVNLQKLLGIVRSSQASYIASDNIFELVKKPSQIPHLSLQLLPNSKLVQITGSPIHGFTSLAKLMRQHGIQITGKLSPSAAAEACAVLASKKLGYLVEPFENETKIVVSRSKSKGPGGWSQKRFGRLIDTTVNQEAKKIESNLIEHRLDFDKRKSRSKFGAQRVVFSIYAPISEIYKIVKKKKGEICQVNIYPVNKERVEFIPLSQQVKEKSSLRRLIVGIDPGLTVGLSVLNLNGQVLKISSYREASRGQIIREIIHFGKPTLICVDVYPYPSYVEKVASTLNARLYTPRSVMTVSEKNEIARKLAMQQGVMIKNAHQRDALASAYRGYNKFKSEFENIDRKYFDNYDKSLREEIKDMIVKGNSLTEAINEIDKILEEEKEIVSKPVEVKEPEKEILPEVKELLGKIDILQEQLDWERSKNSELNIELRELEEKIDYLTIKLDEGKSEYVENIQREKMYLVKENHISFLREKVQQMEEDLERVVERNEELKSVALLRGHKGWVPLKVIRKFTQDEIEKTAKAYDLGPGDTVYILDTTGGGGQTAEKLLSYRIKAIIGNVDQFSYYAKMKLIEAQLPLANPSDVEITRIDEIAIIKETDLNNLINKAEQNIDKIVTKEKETFLDGLLEEYRTEREREIKEYDKKLVDERRNNKVLDDLQEEEE